MTYSTTEYATIQKPSIEFLEKLGYELYDVLYLKEGANKILRIVIDQEKGISLDDCEKVSRTVSALLDVDDPFSSRYVLEISSPGIDRPLIKALDYVRFAGFDAKVETLVPLKGRRRFKGKILGLTDDEKSVRLDAEEGEVSIELENISKAKLILTDDLLKYHQIH